MAKWLWSRGLRQASAGNWPGNSRGKGRKWFARPGGEHKLMETVDFIKKESGEAIYVPTDVTDRDQVANLFDEVMKNMGRSTCCSTTLEV